MAEMTSAQKFEAMELFTQIVDNLDERQNELCERMGVSPGSMSAWKRRKIIPWERVNDHFGLGKGLVSIGRSLGISCDLHDFRPDIWHSHHAYEAPEADTE